MFPGTWLKAEIPWTSIANLGVHSIGHTFVMRALIRRGAAPDAEDRRQPLRCWIQRTPGRQTSAMGAATNAITMPSERSTSDPLEITRKAGPSIIAEETPVIMSIEARMILANRRG
jgi:hypothetical protein